MGSTFVREDSRGISNFVSDGSIVLDSDRDQDGIGDIILRTGGIERGRILHDGTVSGVFSSVVGGVLPYSGVTISDPSFTNSYDTSLWIAPSTRNNPTKNFQGIYVQTRITGDMGGLVHDATASELRLSGVTNGGAAENAFEASLVVSGGANTIAALNGIVVNFHTENTPSGTATSIALIRASTVAALTGTFAITTLYSLYVEQQTVGATNYSLYVAGGDSVFQGQIRPSTTSTAGLVVRGLASQGTTQPMFAVQNSTPTTLFSFFSNGTGGVGGTISGTSFWINNNLASTSTVALIVRGISGQTVDLQRWQDSTPTTHMSITAGGLLRWNAAGDVQTTVGAAGGAATIPSSPTKYLKIVGDDGVTYVVPAFAAT